MPKTEHILLESDTRQVPNLRDARTVHSRIEFRSRLRRRVVQLEIIDYYYLAVRSRSRAGLLEYVLDLRFVGAPELSRRIAWRWIGFSLAIAFLAVAIAFRTDLPALPWWQRHWLAISGVVACVWSLAVIAAVYRTCETCRLSSMHGAATLMECTGGLGTLRVLQRFLAQLAVHIRLAAGARRHTKSEHLRDEMREHLRLKEVEVLSLREYEKAKARILGEHSRTPQSAVAQESKAHAVTAMRQVSQG